MQKMQIMKGGFAVAATMSMLVACGPAPTANQSPSPTATPTAAVTATPTPAVTTTPTPADTATPSPSPSATATATASPTASASATATASATPSGPAATATSDISVVEKTTLNGKVFDDTNAPLDGVTIRAKSLNSTVPFDATTTTSGGSYAFNNAPSGVQIEVMATRAGYTSRRRVEVLKSNKTGDPNANRYDFGNDGSGSTFGVAYNALSDKPEVTTVTPGRNASGVDYKTSFVLKFSEPMDRATVVDNFEVYSFNSKKFTVDTSANANTVTGPGSVDLLTGTRIWDKAAFTVSWNSDDTEATFTFKEERTLPTDRDSAKTPDYQVGLNRQDGSIKDKSGISRGTAEKKFKLTDGDFERSYKFSIKTDEVKPKVDSLVAQTAENSGVNSDGDVVKVRFSERMIHYTLGPTIAGGMGGVASQAAGANNSLTGIQVAPNYKVTIIRQAVTQMNQTTWANLGGRALFDTNDPTHKTVLLLPPVYPNATQANSYLNNQTLTTAAGSYLTEATNNNAYNFTLLRTGAANVAIAVTPANSLANNTTFAADLQAKLNAAAAAANPATSANPFTVTASAATNGTISVTFNDTSGNYQGFTGPAAPAATGADVLPSFNTGGITLTQNQSTNIYLPGDNVIIKVDTTVLDPAGNSVDSSSDNASGNAS